MKIYAIFDDGGRIRCASDAPGLADATELEVDDGFDMSSACDYVMSGGVLALDKESAVADMTNAELADAIAELSELVSSLMEEGK